MYIQAVSVEKVLETIEDLMTEYSETQFLFIWDSIAATSSEKDLEGDFNPQSSMAVKPRIFAKHSEIDYSIGESTMHSVVDQSTQDKHNFKHCRSNDYATCSTRR